MDHSNMNINNSSGNNDLTRAAQARRRQRVMMNASTSTTSHTHVNTTDRNANQRHHTSSSTNKDTTSTTSTSNTVDLMNQSMEVGMNAASLLASIRKEREIVTRSEEEEKTDEVETESKRKIEKDYATAGKIPQRSVNIDTNSSTTTSTITPTSYFRSMLNTAKPNKNVNSIPGRTSNTPTTSSTSTSSTTTVSKHAEMMMMMKQSDPKYTMNDTKRNQASVQPPLSSRNTLVTTMTHPASSVAPVPTPVAAVTVTTTTKRNNATLDSINTTPFHQSQQVSLAPLSISIPLFDPTTTTSTTTTTTTANSATNSLSSHSSCATHTGTTNGLDSDRCMEDTPATYILHGSLIRIQSLAYPTRTMACTQNRVNDKEDDDENDKNHNGISPTATLDGDFLQDSIEVFQIIKSNMPNVDHRHSKENDHHMVLYYGDVVQLVQTGCTTNTNIAIPTAHVLTCTSTSTTTTTAPTSTTTFTNSNPSNTNRSQSDATASHTIQFVPYKDWSSHRSPITSPPLQQLWKILSTYEPSTTITTTSSSSSSSTNYPNTIKVGHAALEEDAIQRQWSSYPNQSTRNQIPVRYNDNIVLRNCSTGGILSCSSRGEIGRSTTTDSSHLHILTDAAFQPHIDMTNYQETEVDDENSSGRKHNYTRTSNMNNTKRIILPHHETSAISRLQQSSQFIPSMYEIFSLVHPAVPIMPLWIKPPPFRLPNQEQQLQLLRPSFTTACYMDMSYLLYPDRHEIMEDIAGTFLHQSLNVYDNNDHDDILPDTGSPTIAQQEQILLYELINACVGMEGRWIRAEVISDCSTVETTNSTIGAMNNIQFRLYDDRRCRWDVIVRRLIEDMLLLPTLFVRIQYFMHYHTPGYEYGHVMQAYCCRLGQLLHDYIATVVSWYQQYKKGSLTLTTFQIELHTSIRALSILYQICQTVQCHKGGALINAIRQWQRTRSDGDTVSEQMVSSLLDVVSVPFIQRLLDWLELGVLSDDPFSEFMIQCCYDPNTSWENQYTLVSKNVLEGFFATDQLVEQVLATGRYWNAIRSCRSNHRHEELVFQDTNSGPTSIGSRIQYSSNISSVSAFILTKYRDSSRSLLRLLIDDFDLVHVLRTMKQYFLLEHGDFFVNFLDCAEDELLKDVTKISRTKIQHWMNSCRQSLVDDEKDVLSKGNVLMNGLQCCISTDGLADYLDKLHAASGGIDTKDAWTPMRHTYGGTLTSTKGELTGLDTFYIDLTPIPFPLSTVLSSNAIGCYHLLFRHLFYAKYVERRMVSIWNDHQMMKELKSLRGPMGATFLLRQRMLHLLQNLIYYMILEVIEPNWLIMEKAINAPTSNTEATVDDILQHHTQFLQRTLEACLLTNRDVVRALTKLLKTCLLFSEQMKRFMKASKLEEERNAVAIEKEKDAQHDFYSRLTKRTMAKAPVKHLQDHFRQNRSDRLDRVQRQSARIEREVCGEPYQRMITRFEEVFTKNLKDFMIQINNSDDIYHTHKVNLCIRLDYNGYITSSLGLG